MGDFQGPMLQVRQVNTEQTDRTFSLTNMESVNGKSSRFRIGSPRSAEWLMA
jgi:hypothetical protein